MNTELNRLTIYRLPPEEVEQLLVVKFGDKMAAVNPVRLARQNQKRANYATMINK
ncbi:MAG: hypothetical protein P4N59_05840 [Negativicutes bacterium]|nr:hypothetical protein [Negativicutes bacterium]